MQSAEIASTFETEIQHRITAYLDAIEQSAGTAGSFVSEQTPLVAQEFLAWTFWCGCLQCLVSSIAIIALWAFIRWTYKAFKGPKYFDDGPGIPVAMIGTFVISLLIASAYKGGYDAAKVSIAPRIVLLEKVSSLVK